MKITEWMRRRKVQKNAMRQALGHDQAVTLNRGDFSLLLRLVDEQGFPLVHIYYDREKGLTPTFMGKPVVWASTNLLTGERIN